MKSAGQTLADMMRGDPGSVSSADLKCAECGKPLKVSIPIDSFSKFPQLECLSNTIVCGNCYEFRDAFRNSRELLERTEVMMRQQMAACLRLEADQIEQRLSEVRGNFRIHVENAIGKMVRVLSNRTGRPRLISDQIVDNFMSVVQKRTDFAGDSYYVMTGKACASDCSGFLLSHYGVTIRNHWKTKRPPERRPVAEPVVVEPP